jgi:hypothetical protein
MARQVNGIHLATSGRLSAAVIFKDNTGVGKTKAIVPFGANPAKLESIVRAVAEVAKIRHEATIEAERTRSKVNEVMLTPTLLGEECRGKPTGRKRFGLLREGLAC